MPPKKKAEAEPNEEGSSSPSKKPRAKKKASEIFTKRDPTPHRPISSDRSHLLKVPHQYNFTFKLSLSLQMRASLVLYNRSVALFAV